MPARLTLPASTMACLSLCLHLAGLHGALAQDRPRLEDAARWAVRSAIPDGVDDWPVFTELRLHPHVDAAGRAVVLACGTVEFADPSAGRTRFAVLLAPDAPDWRHPLSPPVFFGMQRAEHALPIAELCDEAARRQAPGADLHAARSASP